MTDVQPLRVVVDRREGHALVVIEESGREYQVLAEELPADCRAEGAVLDVPLDARRVPLWLRAVRNTEEERRLRREADEALARLRKRDPGGDVEL